MTQIYYTVDQFQQLFDEGEYTLDDNILKIIQYLEENIVIPPDAIESAPLTNRRISEPLNSRGGNYNDRIGNDRNGNRNRRSGQGNSGFNKRGGNSGFSRSSIDTKEIDWETARNFKTTKIATKEGVDKHINDIRVMLNKLSAKNYDTQKSVVISKIMEILETLNVDPADNSDDEDDYAIVSDGKLDQCKIANAVLDIASANKFLSELYSDLYLELVGQNAIFNEILVGFTDKYIATIHEIHYIDANVDYDGFCNYNKTNDTRKSMATFIVNLMKRGLISNIVVLNMIVELQNLTNKYIDEENRTNEVDEITENIALFVSMCKPVLSNEPIWTATIAPNIKQMTTMKAKEHKSLSSRVVFKYMDL